MDIRRDFHMAEGEGELSYSKNSRRQVIILSLFLGYNYVLCNSKKTMFYVTCIISHVACTKFVSNDMSILLVFTIATTLYCHLRV
jgi:hypothetical protein